ncbi:hypothetical protein C8R46DRAFT_373907 [Mycena filopes]|nr:hypothetical protein C8R46DRAFT_373907 [Mycena filopes]
MDAAAAAAAEVLHDAIVDLQNVAATRYVSAAGLVILLYDHLLTLGDEVEYIWKAPTTAAKVLFLIMRYMVPSFLVAETVTRSGLSPIPMSDFVCKVWTSFVTYGGWVSIVISNFLVLLRIWTTLPRGHRLITWSIYFFVVMQLVNLGTTTWVVTNIIPVLVFEPLVGLCTFSTKPNVTALWLPGLAFEVVVFGTCTWNVLERPRSLRNTNTNTNTSPDAGPIGPMLIRDGLVYFVILCGLRVANTVIAIVAPVSSLFIILYFVWAGVTLTTSRLIINSRRSSFHLRARARARLADQEDLDPEYDFHEYEHDPDGGYAPRRAGRSSRSTRMFEGESGWIK